MQKLGGIFQGLVTHEALPDESQCSVCGYFDVTHPDVQRVLRGRTDLGHNPFEMARCKCKGQEIEAERRRELRWQQANLPHLERPRTMTNFNPRPGTEEMYQACKSFLKLEAPHILVLMGRTGSGKSHMLEAVTRESLARDRTARYELSSAFLERLRHCFQMDSPEDLTDLLDWYSRLGVLALDDIGLERGTEWEREQLTRLVEDRITRNKRLIVSTNLAKDEMAERYGDRLASRLYSRNAELGEVKLVAVEAEDYRQQRVGR